ncbi:hypothetical protein [Enterobacter sp.]|uniref:hypothetical protein n=1 Tax=Enterobacter sp. TaxID=42895 RepID=UPI00296F2674|nr:hypothetical protein [Enterobacter sp.]
MFLDNKQKVWILAVVAGIMGGGQQALAAGSTLNVTAEAYIEKGTCTFKVDNQAATSIPFAFNTVTPADIEAQNKTVEKKVVISDCVGTSGINVSLSSANKVRINGDTTHDYLRPADATVKVAYKTEIKTEGGNYVPFYVGATPIYLGGNFSPFGQGKSGNLYIKATLIPAVADIMTIGSGSLDSTATLNMDFL